MSKIGDIVIVIIVIISLSLASFPVATAQGHSVKIEPNSRVSDSAEVGYVDYLTGVISSTLPVRVMIYNNGELIYDKMSTYHYFYNYLSYNYLGKGFEIFVINEYALAATVSYSLKVGGRDIILSSASLNWNWIEDYY